MRAAKSPLLILSIKVVLISKSAIMLWDLRITVSGLKAISVVSYPARGKGRLETYDF